MLNNNMLRGEGRLLSIDVLKAFAIISVVLFHLGLCPQGYLGVDIFFVVAGFFTTKSLTKISGSAGCISFFRKRIFRIWPITIIAGIICLAWGYWFMLPDDYENLAQSVIASDFFSNNILQCITTGNYWDVVNEYKPLMQMWYIGVLFEYYLFIVIAYFIIVKCRKTDSKKNLFNAVIVIAIISFIVYLLTKSYPIRFYYLPSRLYEFCLGSIAFYIVSKEDLLTRLNLSKKVWLSIYALLVVLIFVPIGMGINIALVPLIAFMTTIILIGLFKDSKTMEANHIISNKILAVIGSTSLSLFVWHQVVFAFTRYSFTNQLCQFPSVVIISVVIIGLTWLSYRFIEKTKETRWKWMVMLLLLAGSCLYAVDIYKKAGMVRDVPELGLTKETVHRGIWAEYCDSAFEFDRDFSDLTKEKWLVIGNSFGRDFANIIKESGYDDVKELSYTDNYKKHLDRLENADKIFVSTLGLNDDYVEDIKKSVANPNKVYVVGEKNFGICNGQIYRQRETPEYLHLTIEMDEGFDDRNETFKTLYGDHFIDLIGLVKTEDGTVKVFSDDGFFISQDCRHLTKAGARYFAKLIDWSKLLN